MRKKLKSSSFKKKLPFYVKKLGFQKKEPKISVNYEELAPVIKKKVEKGIEEQLSKMKKNASPEENELIDMICSYGDVASSAFDYEDGKESFVIKLMETMKEPSERGPMFPLLYALHLHKVAKENGMPPLHIIGGWSSFIHVFAARGEKALDEWRGSHDLDFIMPDGTSQSVFVLLESNMEFNVEKYRSTAHSDKYSVILHHTVPAEEPRALQIDLYTPSEDGKIEIEDSSIPLEHFSDRYSIVCDMFQSINTLDLLKLKKKAGRKKDIDDIKDILNSLAALGVDEEIVSKLRKKYLPEKRK